MQQLSTTKVKMLMAGKSKEVARHRLCQNWTFIGGIRDTTCDFCKRLYEEFRLACGTSSLHSQSHAKVLQPSSN